MNTNEQCYLSVIVPVYGAEGFLRDSLNRLDAYIGALDIAAELVLVNDCSPDGSSDIIEEFTKSPHKYTVHYIKNEKNLGKGGTVARGFLAAQGKFRVFTDCDLAYPPEEIGKILARLEGGFDCAIACRVDKDSRYTISPAFFHYLYTRHTASRLLNLMMRWIILPLCRDSQAGLKGLTATAAETIFSRQKIFGFSFDIEVLYLCDRLGYLVAEVPVNYAYFDEPTTIKFAEDSFKILTDIIKIKWNGWRKNYALPFEKKKEKELIVVADDFGYSVGVSKGIIECVRHGIVRSFSVMTNSPDFESSMALLDPVDDYDIGLHLTLTAGKPVSDPKEVPSLVDGNGNFFSLKMFYFRLLLGRIKYRDIYREVTAQFIRLKEKVADISHINGHHHVHALPKVRNAVELVARQNKIGYVRGVNAGLGGSTFKTYLKKRLIGFFKGSYPQYWHRKGIHTAQNFAGFELGGDEKLLGRWQALLKKLPFGTTEVMVHPGRIDRDLGDTYQAGREIELKVLTDASLKGLIEKENIKLVSLRALALCPPCSSGGKQSPV